MTRRKLLSQFGHGLLRAVQPRDEAAEAGQSAVIVAIALIGIVSFAALIFDGGNSFAQRRRMQNAADAGALAGARALYDVKLSGGNDCDVQNAIDLYAVTKNGAQLPASGHADARYIFDDGNEVPIANGCGTPPSNTVGVRVFATTKFNTFFASIFGATTASAGANAAARYGQIGTPVALQPLAKYCDVPSDTKCGFTKNYVYDIYDGFGPGNFGWLSWDGTANSGYTAAMLNGTATIADYVDPHNSCTYLRVGCWVYGNSGVSNANEIKTALNIWLNEGLIGQPMTIIIYDAYEDYGHGNVYYNIRGFATFILIDYSLSAKWVKGKFVDFVEDGDICPTCKDPGLVTINMIP